VIPPKAIAEIAAAFGGAYSVGSAHYSSGAMARKAWCAAAVERDLF
jgi:hypothetical protein